MCEGPALPGRPRVAYTCFIAVAVLVWLDRLWLPWVCFSRKALDNPAVRAKANDVAHPPMPRDFGVMNNRPVGEIVSCRPNTLPAVFP